MVLALIGMMSSAVAAPPPSLVHYQGVLLDNSNNPITGLTTLYFSIYENGLATGFPSSGTLRFRYHEDVTPDAHGVFDVQIGSTPVNIDFGTLTSAIFNTANPLYLEVSIGFPSSLGSVLLPRARFTTVGYAFTADTATNAVGNITPLTVSVPGFGQVIDATGHWTGQPISASGGLATAPKVTGIADATGGILVVGDKLTITGTNLANATATIGGKPAPTIGTPTATQLQCQVPQGVPMGLNDLVVADKSTTGFKASTAVAQLDVHRLIALLRAPLNGGTGTVTIIDANTSSVIRTVTLGSIAGPDTNSAPLSLQSSYGANGALLLVPSGQNTIYAIDMTSSSSAAIDSFTGCVGVRGVAVSPDGVIAAACDFNASGASQIRILKLGESAPPFTNAVLNSSTTLESGEIPANFGATGVAFAGDGQMFVLGRTAQQIITYQRKPGSDGTNLKDIERIPTGDLSSASVSDSVSVGAESVRLQMTHDGTRLLVLNRNPANVVALYASTLWPAGGTTSGAGADASPVPMKIAISPDDKTLIVAAHDEPNNTQTSDRLKTYALVGKNIEATGVVPGPHFLSDAESFEIADVEPVTGNLLCVATNVNHVYLSPVSGANMPIDNSDSNGSSTYLSLPTTFAALSGTQHCLELAFQP